MSTTVTIPSSFWTFGADGLTYNYLTGAPSDTAAREQLEQLKGHACGLRSFVPWGELAVEVGGPGALGQPVTVHPLGDGRHLVTVGPPAALVARTFVAGELEGLVMVRGNTWIGDSFPVPELDERPLADRLVELQQAVAARDEVSIGRVLPGLVATAELRGAVARLLLDARAIMAGDLQALAWSLDPDARRRLAHALVQLEYGAPLIPDDDEPSAFEAEGFGEAAHAFAREQSEAMFVAVVEGRFSDASRALAMLAANEAGRRVFVEAMARGMANIRRESPEIESYMQDLIAPAVGVELPPLEGADPEVLH